MPKFMREKLNRLFLDKLIKLSIALSIGIFFIEMILVFVFFPRFSPYIPFFNSMPWGEKRLADSTIIIVLLFVFFVVIIINTILSTLLYGKYLLISRILSITSFLFVFLGFLATLQIIFLVF